MVTVPSERRWVRPTSVVKAARSSSDDGDGRRTLLPSRKRRSGSSFVSEWTLRLYSCSTHACVASLSSARVRSVTPSSIARSRPSTWAQKTSCFAFWYGLYGSVCSTVMPSRTRPLRLAGDHRRAVVLHEGARQAALLEDLAEAVDVVLGGLGEVPLRVAAQARVVVHDREEKRGREEPRRREHLERARVEVGVEEATDVLDLEAPHLALLDALLGALRARGVAGPEALALEQAQCLHVTPDARIGRDLEPELLGEDAEIIVMKLVAP